MAAKLGIQHELREGFVRDYFATNRKETLRIAPIILIFEYVEVGIKS